MTRPIFDNNFSAPRFHKSHGDFTELEQQKTSTLPARDRLKERRRVPEFENE